jgi:diguanylate cyclase (GGDEF)-like protein/PAS domain S-box-containing protein
MDLSKHSYRKIIEHLRDGLYIVDKERKVVYWNRAAEQISGFKAGEVVGGCCSDSILCHVDEQGANLCLKNCPLAETLASGVPHEAEIFLHHKDGHRVSVAVHVTPLTDEDDEVIGAVEIFSDISSKSANELKLKELEKIAMLDRLTQLANRHYLERELEASLEEKRRYGIPFGVLFVDIDNFKPVNDCYGHETGDRVLQFVAGTLNSNSRPFDLYGRWGGEEFVGIVRNVTLADLEHLGERLRILVGKSFIRAGEKKVQVTISVGATMVTERDSTRTLLHRADSLMYRSKAAGKNRLTVG